jgi:hypothetical protein
MPNPQPANDATQVHKVAQAELRSLPSDRKVFQQRSGIFFRADKQKVLAETVGKLKAIESKK